MNSQPDWDRPELWDFGSYGGESGGKGGPAKSIVLTEIPEAAEVAARSFDPRPDYDLNPQLWGQDALGEHFWSAQNDILTALSQNRYVAVQSCHDAGKSFIAARAAARWISEHDPGEAFVVSTAPTSAQVSAILWREIKRAHNKGAFQGTITTAGYPQWKLGGEIVGYGRKPADYAESAFQGIHARYVLVIIDEACGVPTSLFNAADALATNIHARVLAIGNPDDPTSHFAHVCKPDSGWKVLRIDGLDTPNFTQEAVEWLACPHCEVLGRDQTLLQSLYEEENHPYTQEFVPDSLRDMLLSPMWVEERLHRWVGLPSEGRTLSELATQSALFTSKVRGLFPTSTSEGIVPLGWVELAFARHDEWIAQGSPPLDIVERHILGADIADQGEDMTVVAFREGHIVQEIRKYRNADTMESVGNITAAMSTRPASQAIVDAIGIGAGVVSRMRELKLSVIPFVASGSAKGLKDRTGEFKFINLRAAAWWRMRELLDPSQPGGATICLPRSELLAADLTTPHWKVMSGGAIQIESKDEIRKRLGRSTDEGDAVVMCFWQGRGRVDTSQTGVVSWWDEPTPDSVLSWGVEEMADKEWQ